MNTLKREIIPVALKEYRDAVNKYGGFASIHEAWAVLKEELEELDENNTLLYGQNLILWDCIRQDNKEIIKKQIREMRKVALETACEAVQVLAMCEKFNTLMKGL